MPRKPPPPHPRGQPRTPGSGRKKGTLNRKSIQLRALMAMLVTTSAISTDDRLVVVPLTNESWENRSHFGNE
jgi:hypothetical protein